MGSPYSTHNHRMIKSVEWVPENPAEPINDHIFMSRGTSNGYLVTTSEGDVVINTGMPYQGKRYRERYEELLGRPLSVKKILFTQSHPDHMGGWNAFNDPGAERIAQANFFNIRDERNRLAPFFSPRGARILSSLLPNPEHLKAWDNVQEFDTATLFRDNHAFELGGRRFELYSTPSGETIDSMVVWLPQERAVFIGNLFGALYGALPHLYTLRGDRQRSALQCLRDIDLLLELEPELLITGHDEPIVGADRIRADLSKMRDAVQYLVDQTIKGMAENKDMYTLMAEIKLPTALQMATGRGPESWYVRAIWEELTGWFRCESTTELYSVPQRAIWSELAEMAGGSDALAARAQGKVEAGKPVEALHFTDIALSVDESHQAARRAELAALELLLERSQGRNFDEVGWLESAIETAREYLG